MLVVAVDGRVIEGGEDLLFEALSQRGRVRRVLLQVFLGDGAGRAETDDARDVDRP